MLALAILVLSTTVASADNSTTTTTASTTTTTLPPAPPGFEDTAVSVYQAELAAAQELGQGQGLESVALYQQQMDALGPSGLAQFYSATEQVPEWSQIPSLMQTIVADVPTQATQSSAVTRSAGRSSAPSATLMAMITRPSPGPEAPVGSATLVGAAAGTVNPYNPTGCDTTDYDVPIFAAQIVLDVATGLYDAINPFAHSIDPFTGGLIIDALTVIAAVVAGAAAVVHDTLVYLQTLENECQGNNTSGYIANIDNTTVAAYNLATTIGTSTLTIQTDVANIQTQITSFQTTIQQALTSDTQALQATTGNGNQGTTTELQIIQTALQNDASAIQSAETSNGQQVVAGTTKIQTSLSSALSQALHETDSDAQGLTTLFTQGNQQILNTVQSNFAATQKQYQSSLQILIEQALSGWGPVVPEVELMLPVSMGGLLNATPVGVQEVVTADIGGLQAQGVKVKALAITDLSAANAALAGGKWTVAWTDYEQAYEAAA